MAELSSLLELLHRGPERLRTFRAVYRDTDAAPPASYEIVAEPASDGEGTRLGWRGGGPWPTERAVTRKLWLAAPDRLRVEGSVGHGALAVLGVRDGDQWWRWTRWAGAVCGQLSAVEAESGLPPVLRPALLRPYVFLSSIRLEPAGAAVRAGREVIRARGTPRNATSPDTAFELEFDAEHGTLLRREVRKHDRTVHTTEAIEVKFDESVDDRRFQFDSPDGRPVLAIVQSPNGSEPSDERAARPSASGTIWLTGLPAAGKTTLAHALNDLLADHGIAAHVLDGDVLRDGLSSDLGHSRADRAEQARRTAHLAATLAQAGVMAIVALISPFAEDRQRARSIHQHLDLPFWEVWVDTPHMVCEQRDPKGLYARARNGDLTGLTGIDAPYQVPTSCELRLSAWRETPGASAARVVELILPGFQA